VNEFGEDCHVAMENRQRIRSDMERTGSQVRAESSLSLPPKFSDDLAHLSKTLAHLSKANLVRHPTSRTAAIGPAGDRTDDI
jgi:hypothetical protein